MKSNGSRTGNSTTRAALSPRTRHILKARPSLSAHVLHLAERNAGLNALIEGVRTGRLERREAMAQPIAATYHPVIPTSVLDGLASPSRKDRLHDMIEINLEALEAEILPTNADGKIAAQSTFSDEDDFEAAPETCPRLFPLQLAMGALHLLMADFELDEAQADQVTDRIASIFLSAPLSDGEGDIFARYIELLNEPAAPQDQLLLPSQLNSV